MTAVVRLEPFKHPVIVADLLVSGKEVEDQLIALPTIGPVTRVFPHGSGFIPNGLRQKIALLGDDLVIAWSGDAVAARYAIREMRHQHKQKRFNRTTLLRFLTQEREEIWGKNELSLVGYLRDDIGVARFQAYSQTVESDLFGRMEVIGGGGPDLGSHIRSLEEHAETIRASTPNDAHRAVSTALLLSGALLNRERATANSVLQYYGGGYEIATTSVNKFIKMGDITYLFWDALVQKDGMATRLVQVCKYTYEGDVLVIRTGTFSNDERADREQTGDSQEAIERADYVVDPIYRHTTIEEARRLPVRSFDSRWVCNYFFLRHGPRLGDVYSHINYSGSGARPIRFYENDHHFMVTCDPRYMKQMIANAQSTYWES